MEQDRRVNPPVVDELEHGCPQEKAARARMVHLLHTLLLKENGAPAALEAIVSLRAVFNKALLEHAGDAQSSGSSARVPPPHRCLRANEPRTAKLLQLAGAEALLCTGGFRPKTMNFEKQYVFDPEEAGRTARVTLGVQGGQVPSATDVYSASPAMHERWRSVGFMVLRACEAQLAKVEDSARAAAEKNVHEKELKHAAKAAERAQLLSAIEEDKEARKKKFTYQ